MTTPAARAHQHRALAVLLAALSALGPFSIDAYLPSFQEIGAQLRAPPLLVQQTLTAYMVPFAAMTLWHGALSDALGRRRLTLALLGAFALASLGCMAAPRIEVLLVCRALQGMTAGAGMVIGRAIVRDVLEGDEARRLMSHVALVFAVAPALGPVLGGWLHVWWGWRAVFAFLALFAAALLAWCWRALPETLPPHRRRPLGARALLAGYLEVLRAPRFLLLVAAVTCNFAAVFVYIVSAPVFLLRHLHLGATSFLWLFGPISAGMLAGNGLSARLTGRLSNRRTVALGYAVMLAAAAANVALHALRPPGLPWSLAPLVAYVVGTSLAMPSLTLLALDLFPERRGLAASCQAFVQTAGNALVAAALAPLAWGSALGLSLAMAGVLAAGLAAFTAAAAPAA